MDASELIERFPDATPAQREMLAVMADNLIIRVDHEEMFGRHRFKVKLLLDTVVISEDYVDVNLPG